MAVKIKNTIRVNVTTEKVWEVLKDFGALEKFAPTIASSPITNDITSGVGAIRKCVFFNDSSMSEKITEYQEGHGYKIEIIEHKMPFVSKNVEEMNVVRLDDHTCEINMSVTFEMSGGPLGWMVGSFMLKPMMTSVTKKIITGLAYHAKTGKLVGDKLPPKDDLTFIL